MGNEHRSELVNVVVGAGSGMGAAAAAMLAKAGPLLVADRDLAAVTAVAAELGSHVEPTACDVTDPEQVAALAGRVGRLGRLVHTAGVSWSMASGRRIY
nr:SDR family NAD(P)-dependent oxidoreductase [Micromonospora sp. DSM 115978]